VKDFVPEGTAYFLEQTILLSAWKFHVVVLLGPRAVDKTTLLRRPFPKTHNYIPLELNGLIFIQNRLQTA
jgi:hypothetical protein